MRRFPFPMVALLVSSCLLEDPYYIDEGTSLTGPENPENAKAEPEPPAVEANNDDIAPEPDAAQPPAPEGEPEPQRPEPPAPPPEPEPDIIVDPASTLPEPVPPEPAVVPPEPAPEPVAPPPEPMPEPPTPDIDAGMPEPADMPPPAPEPTPELDAGTEPCRPGSPGCAVTSDCGNGSREPGEACDGEDLAALSCYDQGFSGGTLSCSSACELDTSECTSGPSCEATTIADTGLVYEGNLNGKRNDVRGYSCSLGGRDTEDVTLAWTAPSSGCFTISVDSTEAIDTIIGVFDDCSIENEIACDNEHNSSDPDSILQFEATAHTTYALAIDAYEPGDEASILVTIAQCAPSEWTCTLMSYGDGQSCDCGCGAEDPDCADSSVDSCDTCGADGACGSYGCQGVDEEQNWTCGEYGGPFGR